MADQTQQIARLRAAASAMPVLDKEAASRAAAAKQLQIDSALQQAPAGAGVREAQAIAPQVVQNLAPAAVPGAAGLLQAGGAAAQLESQAAQSNLQEASRAQKLNQTESAAKQGLAENAASRDQQIQMTKDEAARAKKLQDLGLGYDSDLAFMSQKQREDLAKLGRDVKAKLFDDRLTFEGTAQDRKFTSDRQMADYMVASAKSSEDLQNKAQIMTQNYERKAQLYDQAYKVASAELDRQLKKAEQSKDQVSKKKIIEIKMAFDKEVADKKRDASNKKALIMGVTTVAAAVASVYGTPVAGAGVMAAGTAYANKEE